MPYHSTIRGERFAFADLRELMAKANEEKSGDSLAGIAAATNRERVAAKSCESAGTDIATPGWYVIKQGDTLWNIAEKHYGAGWRYRRIFAANRRRLSNPHYISPCQRVYLPRGPHRA